MNPYLVVKKQPPKEKPPPKIEEITIILKKPFIMDPIQPIEQPRLKVANLKPKVVHIIDQRPKKKEEVQKINSKPLPVHIIQPSKNIKGRYHKFTNLFKESDDEKQVEEKNGQQKKIQKKVEEDERKQILKKIEEQRPRDRKEQNKENDGGQININGITQVKIIETEEQMDEIDEKKKIQLQRKLVLAQKVKPQSIALPQQQDSYEGRQSLKHKRALLVMKDKQGQMYHQQILIPQEFQLKQQSKPFINLKRNLKHNNQPLNEKISSSVEPINEKISSSAVNSYPIDQNIEIYPIQQSYNPKEKRTLFRNLQLPKQIKSQSIALPQQQDSYEGRQSLKHKRALLVMKDKQGQMYHQQILIPQEFQLKQQSKPFINLKRNLKHNNQPLNEKISSSVEPINEKISSSAVNSYPIDQNIEIYPIQQSYNPKEKRTLFRNLQLPKQIKSQSIALPQQQDSYEGRQSLKHKRALLVMKDKQGQMYHQQILIPQEFQLKQQSKPFINLKRNLKHNNQPLNEKISSSVEPINEKISSSAVNSYPIDQNIEIYPIQQSYNPKEKRTLFRNLQLPKQIKSQSIALPQQQDSYEGRQSLKHKRALLVMKDKQGQMYHQQILIPQEFQLKQQSKPFINLKRNLKHNNQPLNEKISSSVEPINEKISSSAVNSYPIDQNIEIYPIQQSYNPKEKRTLFRNLQLPKQIKSQSIALPQQQDSYEGRQSLKHKRALLVMKDKQGQMYHQQILIPQEFQLKQQSKPFINLKRNLKHNNQPLNEKISSSVEPINEKISSSAVNSYPIDQNIEIYPIQQSYNPKEKRTLFRNLQLPKQIKSQSIALPQQQDSYEGRQSLKHKRALLVMKDKQGQMYHQQILIPQEFQLKQQSKPFINLKRNLKHNNQPLNEKISSSVEPINEKISSSAVNSYPIDQNIEIYPIQQSYNPKEKRTLFRNLQLPKQIKSQSIALPQQQDSYEGRQSLKHKRALLVMKDKQGQMYHQQILIPQEFQLKQQSKPFINLKRNLKHNNQPLNEKISSSVEPINEKISSSAVNSYPIDQNIEIYPIQQSYNPKEKRTLFRNLQLPKQIKSQSIALPQQQDSYEGRQSLKHKRALLVMKDKQGQMYHQQILIPQEFQLKQQSKPFINLKRNLKHNNQPLNEKISSSVEPINEKISSSAVNSYPIDQNIEIYPIQQSYNPKEKRTLFRNLQLPKQIKSQSIALPQQQDSYEGRQSLKHKRALLVMKDKQGQMYHQQILIPQEFQLKQQSKPFINLKRNLKHNNQPLNEKISSSVEPINEKISSSAVNSYPIDQNIEIYPIQQSYNPKEKRTLFRNLQLPKQIKSQSIALPQQQDSYEGRQSLKHKRALLVMKDKQGQMYHQQILIPQEFQLKQQSKPFINLKRNLKHNNQPLNEKISSSVEPINEKISSSAVNSYPIDQNIEIYPIQQSYNPKEKRTLFRNLQLPKQIKSQSIALPQQQDSYEGRQSLKHKRALLVMKDKQGQMYHQQILIPQEFQLKQQSKPFINLKRNLKHNNQPLNEKISSSVEPINEKISSSAVNSYPIDQNIEIYPIQQSYNPKEKRTLFRNLQLPKQIKSQSIALPQQQDSYEGRQSLKHKRALLVMKDKQGQMYHQQILIPQEFQLKQQSKPFINLKRNLKHNNQPLNEKISSSIVQPYSQPSFNIASPQHPINNSVPLQKSFPSTLNSSLPNNPYLSLSSPDSQQFLQNKSIKLQRSLLPQRPPQIQHSKQKQSKIFNVYNPSSFLSETNSFSSKSSLPQQLFKVCRTPRPHRRPGFYS